MKILALDIGDVWTGTAISDALGLLARPYKTVTTKELATFIQQVLQQEPIHQIIVGNPTTLRGTESQQTEKIHAAHKALAQQFTTVEWLLWDERLSSKRAQTLKAAKTAQQKQESHSIAAAFILTSYLDYLHIHKQ